MISEFTITIIFFVKYATDVHLKYQSKFKATLDSE